MNSIALNTFLARRAQNLPRRIATAGVAEIGAARMHYESLDSWTATVTSCRDWRAEILMCALDASGDAPDIAVGFVDFLIVRLGEEPVADVLNLYGAQAAAFAELFDGEWCPFSLILGHVMAPDLRCPTFDEKLGLGVSH